MDGGSVLGLLLLRPARTAFDATMRQTLAPELRTRPGMRGIWVGRRGPDELGERAIVTLWDSAAALRQALGDDPLVSWLASAEMEATQPRFGVLPVWADVRAPAAPRPAILRIARGRLTHIDLTTYAQHVDAGARRDVARGRGPDTLMLGASGPDTFVTVSTWADWESIAWATGASLDRPVRTREQHVLADFSAVHYELVRV